MMNAAPFGVRSTNQRLKPLPLRQAQATELPTGSSTPVRFGGSSTYQKVLNQLDFREMGASFVNQIKVVYALCIGWRLIAANERRKDSPLKSWNELRENALRDSMGFMFWFFATPLLQRGLLWYVTNKHDPSIGNSLYQKNTELAKEKGFLGKLKAWNPLYSVNIPSSEQVSNQQKQALHHLHQAGITANDPAFHATEAFYKKLFMYRNVATALGLLNTIVLIGIGINLFNFYLTRKNMECRKQALQRPTFPTLPTLPALPKPALNGMSSSPPMPTATQPAASSYPIPFPKTNRLA